MNKIIIDGKMNLVKKRKVLYIVDGIMNYPITITSNNIICKCPCNTHNLCKHVLYYMYINKLDLNLLVHWNKIKEHIYNQIITKKINNDTLWEIVDNNIIYSECPICLDKIELSDKYILCKHCKNTIHSKCNSEWAKYGKHCVLCRH